ncbi:MAG: sigma-54-dependent Fis family transcriptional regulator [Candidatus Brocadia sp. AMX2]|nr:MAG: sigma-54-dependent Fis family transcriptional regulator [Candidatus Brocadia sp. AMX2]MBC6933121.1 sigma-54-dependent Fis family transcriptional regulator [Candidatus Brocadia sp.]MBL1168399.1 sigma-54-dependent Fis family transcriptional regulator [Candidatus Brocadia sp. AMX1]MCK6468415.1 sigma-54 dependent transcriptional regulator [Candidatus Brocadia sinica]NOG43193.1 sigma-54-dependent Fis family transcriptional regulator [Planctomycetota bacterium]
MIEKIPSLAWSDATVMIYGETGTGKELIARAIHYNSHRHGKPFIPVNCGALPDHLIENELFGHAKGAFTDASTAEKGLIAEAEGGALFLDEVDTLSSSAQIKLLRFLQDKEYRHLGSSKSRGADVRVIAATNSNLWYLVETKRFREDLYYRLNVLSVTLPPLRERVSDIPLLAAHFLTRYAKQNRRGLLHLSGDAMQKLIHYPWSGNVRELEGVIQRAAVLCASSVLEPEDIDHFSPCGGSVIGRQFFAGRQEGGLQSIHQCIRFSGNRSFFTKGQDTSHWSVRTVISDESPYCPQRKHNSRRKGRGKRPEDSSEASPEI